MTEKEYTSLSGIKQAEQLEPAGERPALGDRPLLPS